TIRSRLFYQTRDPMFGAEDTAINEYVRSSQENCHETSQLVGDEDEGPEIFVELVWIPISDRLGISSLHPSKCGVFDYTQISTGTFGFLGSEATSVCRLVVINAFYFT